MLNLKVKGGTHILYKRSTNGLEIIIETPDKCVLEVRQISLNVISKEPMNARMGTNERKKKRLQRRFTDYITLHDTEKSRRHIKLSPYQSNDMCALELFCFGAARSCFALFFHYSRHRKERQTATRVRFKQNPMKSQKYQQEVLCKVQRKHIGKDYSKIQFVDENANASFSSYVYNSVIAPEKRMSEAEDLFSFSSLQSFVMSVFIGPLHINFNALLTSKIFTDGTHASQAHMHAPDDKPHLVFGWIRTHFTHMCECVCFVLCMQCTRDKAMTKYTQEQSSFCNIKVIIQNTLCCIASTSF